MTTLFACHCEDAPDDLSGEDEAISVLSSMMEIASLVRHAMPPSLAMTESFMVVIAKPRF